MRRLIYFGASLPLGDQILRFFHGELWYYSQNLIFHSLVYQIIFWSLIVIYYWVYTKQLQLALTFLSPLIGFFTYMLFCHFSTCNAYFFAPFNWGRYQLNWIKEGFAFPLVLLIIGLFLSRWYKSLNKKMLSYVLVCITFFYITAMGVFQLIIKKTLPHEWAPVNNILVFPVNYIQTKWFIRGLNQDEYLVKKFNLFTKESSQTGVINISNDTEIIRSLLLDPELYYLAFQVFRSPVFDIQLQNEGLILTIKEITELNDYYWPYQITLKKNRFRQTVEQKIIFSFFSRILE